MKKVIDLVNYNKAEIGFEILNDCPKIEDKIICDGSNQFYSRMFKMEKWWFSASNVGEREGPYIFIGETEGTASLMLFTNRTRASSFAKNNRIKTNEKGEYVIGKTPLSVVTSIGDYIKLGIKRVVIDLCWQIDLEKFRGLYFESVKQYDFKKLVRNASIRGNKSCIGELWTAIFNINAWYFIGNLEKGIVYGTKVKEDKAIFVYLSYSEVYKTISRLNIKEDSIKYKIYKYSPEEGYEFLMFMKKEAFVNGIVLRTKDVYSVAKIDTIMRVREIFNI